MDAATTTSSGMAAAAASMEEEETTGRIGDLPESILAQVISLTASTRDACRCAAVSPAFLDAADSDAVWERFLPPDYDDILLRAREPPHIGSAGSDRHAPEPLSKKEAFRRLFVNGGSTGSGGGAGKCVALSARKLSLPWDDDGESGWRWTPHPYIP